MLIILALPRKTMASDGALGTTTKWPPCAPDQVQVMLLGTFHMHNPGLDEVNVRADDVLSERRQEDLQTLADRLVDWEPNRIAVERPYDRAETVNEQYRSYAIGERTYGVESSFHSTHPLVSETDSECRSEVVQVGFRVADSLGHDRVYPIDEPMDLGNKDLTALEERGLEPERKIPVEQPDHQTRELADSERLASSTITSYLAWLNREEQLRYNHEGMFGQYIRYGRGDNYGGPQALARWYQRNRRMVHHLWRAIEPSDERLLLIVGSGHVRVLRHLLEETPQFCPVSPLPYLT